MESVKQNPVVSVAAALIVGLVMGAWLFGGDHGVPMDHADHSVEASSEWTCSMHPQVRQSEPGDCPICGMDLIPVGSSSSRGPKSAYESTMSPEAVALAGIVTSPVRLGHPKHELYLTGRIAVDERRIETMAATFPGRIERLYVDFTGQRVEKGDRLATLYSPTLITAQQELLEAARVREGQPGLYRAAREKLRLWRIEREQIDAIEASGQVQSEFDLLAETSGVVLSRRVAVGDYVAQGAVLFEVANLQKLWVLLDAYESDLAQVREGAEVRFEVASLPGESFESKVTFVDPVIDPERRTARVRAEVDNASRRLRPDVFVRARVLSRSSGDERILIPKTAVLWTGKRSVVYVRLPDTTEPRFQMREVTLGPRSGADYAIVSGLEAGESVVSQGAFAVDAAAQLMGGHSMLSRSGEPALEVPDRVLEQMAHLVHEYFNLKHALVADNLDGARAKADMVLLTAQRVDATKLSESANKLWQEQAEGIATALRRLIASKDIAAARAEFHAVSQGMIGIVERFEPDVGQAFVQFCPMALDFSGAHWLSEIDEVRNPYFGDEMLNCGDTVRPISRVGKANGSTQPPAVHNH